MTARRKLAVAAAAYTLLLRPKLLKWGATEEEVHATYPGDGIVEGGRRTSTMAATIDAPPSAVWPWLVQMGCNRAGWYSWDRVDNGGRHSAESINPEWQEIAIGDRIASTPRATAWFTVAAIEPERFLAFRASVDLRGHPFDPAVGRPPHYVDSLWCFLLEPQSGERTRLVVSGYVCSQPRAITAIGDLLFWEPARLVMQTRQFANLKRRAATPQPLAAATPQTLEAPTPQALAAATPQALAAPTPQTMVPQGSSG